MRTCEYSGLRRWQWPHQGAVNDTSQKSLEFITLLLKSLSVSSMTEPEPALEEPAPLLLPLLEPESLDLELELELEAEEPEVLPVRRPETMLRASRRAASARPLALRSPL